MIPTRKISFPNARMTTQNTRPVSFDDRLNLLYGHLRNGLPAEINPVSDFGHFNNRVTLFSRVATNPDSPRLKYFYLTNKSADRSPRHIIVSIGTLSDFSFADDYRYDQIRDSILREQGLPEGSWKAFGQSGSFANHPKAGCGLSSMSAFNGYKEQILQDQFDLNCVTLPFDGPRLETQFARGGQSAAGARDCSITDGPGIFFLVQKGVLGPFDDDEVVSILKNGNITEEALSCRANSRTEISRDAKHWKPLRMVFARALGVKKESSSGQITDWFLSRGDAVAEPQAADAELRQLFRHGGDAHEVTQELIKLVGDDGGFCNRAKIEKIGRELNRIGGIKLMGEHYSRIQRNLYFSQDIWDGIGSWQS